MRRAGRNWELQTRGRTHKVQVLPPHVAELSKHMIDKPPPDLSRLLLAPMPGHAAGEVLRGHEFHYSTVLAQPDPPLARVEDAEGAPVALSGSCRGRVSGTFFHLVAADARAGGGHG